MTQPAGRVYRPELISESDEQALLDELERLDFHERISYEVLVQRYPEGAQIGWHRDAPMFGTVLGVSLLAARE